MGASDFAKSGKNRGVEREGLRALLKCDDRFQAVDLGTKRAIIDALPVGDYGVQTFDAVMTPEPTEQITVSSIARHLDELTLIEMKTTRKRIKNGSLNGFFFGATEREYQMAAALGDRYKWAFVVLSTENEYGMPFVVLLSLEEVEQRTRAKRIQYQVNFRSDIDDIGETFFLRELGEMQYSEGGEKGGRM